VGLRNELYRLARVLGDLNALKKGKPAGRLGRRLVGSKTKGIVNKIK